MTTTGQPDGTSWREWSEWWAHVEPLTWIGVLGFGVAVTSLGMPGWFWTGFSVVAALVIIINSGKHENRLCSRCAAKAPLDPQRSVRRAKWALWLYHRQVLLFGIGIGFFFARGYVPVVVAGLLGIGTFVVLSLLALVGLRHRWLRRWCPYCPRWGGGGDGPVEYVPVPGPQPVGVKRT